MNIAHNLDKVNMFALKTMSDQDILALNLHLVIEAPRSC